ncbi:MAG: mediator complex subunit [Vezdaea aestivalis]|nr:MAG: mediator complex subunit [Vezdaea aestivalis]
MDEYSYDELFDDAANLPIPPAPLVKGLTQRIDQLQTSACCQKLTWSKVGCIAYIDRTGEGVILRSLLSNPDDGTWTLGKEHQVPNLSGAQLTHLSWNHSGSELAIVDVSGRVSIYNMFVVLNDLRPMRNSLLDQEDDQSAVVGLYWLNAEHQLTVHQPAEKDKSRWKYNAQPFKSVGPFHPSSGKLALIVVTKGGTVRLLYQLPDSQWQETEESNYLYLATFTASYQLSLYALMIQWKTAKLAAGPLNPGLSINRLCTKSCRKPPLNTSLGAEILDPEHKSFSYPSLTHLEILPFNPALKQAETLSTILGIFLESPLDGNYMTQHTPVSVIRRWNIKPIKNDMHPCLETLTGGKSSESQLKKRPIFTAVDDITLEKIVISISYVNHFSIIALLYSDGSVELRDRITLEVLPLDEDEKKVSGMTQTGFSFPFGQPCIHAALSPNACAIFSLNSDMEGALRLIQPAATTATPGSISDPIFVKNVVALSGQLAFSLSDRNNNDDLIAVIKQSPGDQLGQACLNETSSALSVNLDFTFEAQLELLVRHPMLRSYLSIQSSLGYRGEALSRSLSSKIAWATLNLRLTALVFAYTFNMQKANAASASSGAQNADLASPEVLRSLAGAVKWFTDLSNFIVDELFTLGHKLHPSAGPKPSPPLSPASISAALATSNSCALPLIMASAPRKLLRYNVKALRSLPKLVNATFNAHGGPSSTQRQALQVLTGILEGSAVPIAQIDGLLAEIDGLTKTAYEEAKFALDARSEAEKALVLTGLVPQPLVRVVETLFGRLLPALADDANREALYFGDFMWLGLVDRKRTVGKVVVDVLRKITLQKGAALRRCTRCCAVMEDCAPPPAVMWLTHMQKACVCGSLWMTVQQ